MSYPTAPGYEAYVASLGQSYPFGNQGYQTPATQQQMTPSVYAPIQNALQAAALDAQQQQQRYAMANQGYYPNATASAYQTAMALQQQQQREQQQKLIQQQLQQQQQLEQQQKIQQQMQQQQLQQQYARQAEAYQNYPTQAYTTPQTNQATHQQSPGYPGSRNYTTAQMGASGCPPYGGTGYPAGWPSADKQSQVPWATYQPATRSWASRWHSMPNADPGHQNYYYGNRYISRGGYPSGYGVSTVSTPAGYQTQTYGQGYPQPGVYHVQYRYPQGR